MSLAFGAILLSLVGDNLPLGQRAGQLIAVAIEQSFPVWRALGTICRGWVKVKSGVMAEGMSPLHGGSTSYRATGAAAWMPYLFTLLLRRLSAQGKSMRV